jgi:molybdopterin-binding protein
MPLSARNQFPGKVISLKLGAVMAEVVIDIGGGHQIVSLISVSSAKRLKLKKGQPGRGGDQGDGSDHFDGSGGLILPDGAWTRGIMRRPLSPIGGAQPWLAPPI